MLSTLRKPLVCLAMVLVFGLTTASARTVQLVDQQGQPVPDAVLSLVQTDGVSADRQSVAVMDQVNKQFSPRVLVVQKGQRVSFPNSDEIRHHVYSFSAIKPFEIKLYKGSNEAPVEFDQAGVGVLGCNIHDNMLGFVYVAENEIAKVTDQQGMATFEQPLPEQITVWHADLSVQQTRRVTVPVQSQDGQAVATVTLLPKKSQPNNTFGARKFGHKG